MAAAAAGEALRPHIVESAEVSYDQAILAGFGTARARLCYSPPRGPASPRATIWGRHGYEDRQGGRLGRDGDNRSDGARGRAAGGRLAGGRHAPARRRQRQPDLRGRRTTIVPREIMFCVDGGDVQLVSAEVRFRSGDSRAVRLGTRLRAGRCSSEYHLAQPRGRARLGHRRLRSGQPRRATPSLQVLVR